MSAMTKTEARIARHILLGWTTVRIAKEFGSSEMVVRRHVHNIYDKVGCSSHTEFLNFALNREDLLNQIYGV